MSIADELRDYAGSIQMGGEIRHANQPHLIRELLERAAQRIDDLELARVSLNACPRCGKSWFLTNTDPRCTVWCQGKGCGYVGPVNSA